MTETRISSPCIKTCIVDGSTGWCIGCGRTLAEIGNWIKLGPAGRDQVMTQLPMRMDILNAKALAGSGL